MREVKVRSPERATTGCTVLMDSDLKDKVQKLANKFGMSRGTLMRMWIIEGLDRETKKSKTK